MGQYHYTSNKLCHPRSACKGYSQKWHIIPRGATKCVWSEIQLSACDPQTSCPGDTCLGKGMGCADPPPCPAVPGAAHSVKIFTLGVSFCVYDSGWGFRSIVCMCDWESKKNRKYLGRRRLYLTEEGRQRVRGRTFLIGYSRPEHIFWLSQFFSNFCSPISDP